MTTKRQLFSVTLFLLLGVLSLSGVVSAKPMAGNCADIILSEVDYANSPSNDFVEVRFLQDGDYSHCYLSINYKADASGQFSIRFGAAEIAGYSVISIAPWDLDNAGGAFELYTLTSGDIWYYKYGSFPNVVPWIRDITGAGQCAGDTGNGVSCQNGPSPDSVAMDWYAGDSTPGNVGPTAVTLRGIQATNANGVPILTVALMLVLVLGIVVFRTRRSRG